MNPQYLQGWGNYHQSEAMAGALPLTQNSPQQPPFGLYAEQLSGSAFTAQRHHNWHSWLYRIRPSVQHCAVPTQVQHPTLCDRHTATTFITPPEPLRWNPLPTPTQPLTFFQSLYTQAYNEVGCIHLYQANTTESNTFFYNADGDWLCVPQTGRLLFKTEFGPLVVGPNSMVVIQRGIRFQVELLDDYAAGYICETQQAPFVLPERGVIGANGLAEERYFYYPTAQFEQREGEFTLLAKFNGALWQMPIMHSPLDVVAWQGNYVPYAFNFKDFVPVFSALKDHADPSIFTVLTVPSSRSGIGDIDFVIFPPRWMVAEHTFRPPYYHRNIMSEYMGLVTGQYDAKRTGFVPGGSSLHNCMSGHGVDAAAFEQATHEASCQPVRYQDTLAFMFESRMIWQVTEYAYHAEFRQRDYLTCWESLKAFYR